MTDLRIILWIFIIFALGALWLPVIGTILLFLLGMAAIFLLISLISNLIFGTALRFEKFTFGKAPAERAEQARQENEQSFEEEYGEEAGEVVELPSSALHKEGEE